MIGKTLGHYQITSQLGKGGMGEVYQAKDRKLGRDVAIKVLPEEFAKDADRVTRFQREAKLLASLNHPNIAAIHGLEESGGINFLVLELVEGETLADVIKRGPTPVEESLKLALQIAEALEAAHEKGVIHRDLKPANIKVTPDGKVKVLDFGLAKVFAGEKADLNLSNSPTLSNVATQQGVIPGTAAYMSPEQARGEIVDKKADIWAFGCVLFEMLTGRRTFEGRTVSDILASVIKSEPEWKMLPPNLHPRIRLLLERCLEKEPKNRYGVISDARVDIQKALVDPSGVLVQPIMVAERKRNLRTSLPWVAAAVVLTAIIAGVAVWKLKPPEPKRVMRFDYELPEGQQFSDLTYAALAVSADGRQFVYSTPKGLYLRSVSELTAKLIPGTEGGTEQPFFSPDGKWIGYFSIPDSKLKKIAIVGGAPVALCDVVGVSGASWDRNLAIVYSVFLGGIKRISANGGASETLVPSVAPGLLSFPQVLPDGKSILFTIDIGKGSQVAVRSLKSGEQKELVAGSDAHYLQTGHIIYTSGNNLCAIPFDLDNLEVTGGPVSLIESVRSADLSESGTLVYIPGTALAAASGRTLVWVDKQGKEEPLPAPPNSYHYPKISPDGTRLALTLGSIENSDIWIWDLVRKVMTRLTFDPSLEIQSIWTPDGKRVVYYSNHEGGAGGIYWKSADGAGAIEKIASLPDRGLMPYSWSKGGSSLVIAEMVEGLMKWDVGMISMQGEHVRKPLLNAEYAEFQPQISPDGRWIAYVSSESGQNEIYVRPFPEVNRGRWQVSTNGGDSPLWSPDGRELFYLIGNTEAVMAVAVETEPTFKPGIPKTLFRGTFVGSVPSDGTPWDISPDGKRFLMMKELVSTDRPTAPSEAPRKINIVANWSEELKQQVAVK